MSFQSFMFNRMCTKSDKKRDAGLTIPDDIEYIRDISYGRNKKYHILDVCYPKSAIRVSNEDIIDGDSENTPKSMKKLPIIISIHGGGYVYGTKEVYQFYCADLAKRGFAVINFNYRLAPKYKFPAPLEDLTRVFKWIMSNVDDYQFDLDNVFLVGDSAGAQLVSQYAAIYSNREYRNIMNIKKPNKIKIKAVGLACGLYDLKSSYIEQNGKGMMKDYLGSNIDKYGEKLNILDYINKDFPPAYIFSSKGDFLMDNCQPMAELLKERGVKCKYKIYGNKKTGHVFHVNVRDEIGQEANRDQTDFFKKFAKGDRPFW
ncbi:MAG: alpha/beta hydrolase [Eubacterium sp.]|nr:alpha/beta hydrolase [Eubacterium sp.]